ncbi:hypothetical protein K458DRAFT_292398 [Lentithecium fluviatile CBS 122367]|uniref:Uncharacterized protein n=1 Tax=Lentithecium fluviatile CBS 122367 TaxID=1168545 RepID=A0A6G1JH77_9PLEO|nr:hypothetical protein K458DRAFT_292398 [Lentithecium fluviatile CBS 122367]
MVQFAVAQDSVPSDLTAGFDLSLQASFTGEANEGFKDGTSFTKDEVATEPSFALGDSDGIATSVLYTIIMVDTTDDSNRVLHFARANYKHSEGVKLESEDQPLLEYKAPGTLGETGDEKKYTFLLYTNPERNEIKSLTLPGDGETFDVKKFQDDNGLEDPNAGVGMAVALNGGATPSSSSSSSSRRPASTQAPSSTAAQSSSATTGAVSSTSESESKASTSAAPSTSRSTSAPAPSTATGGSEDATSAATGPTTTVAPASPSTVLTSVVPDTTASATTSNAPAEQTTGAGAMLSLPWVQCAVLAPVVAFAGLLV